MASSCARRVESALRECRAFIRHRRAARRGDPANNPLAMRDAPQLILRARGAPPSDARRPLVACFDVDGGRIGRDPSCTLALVRSDRHVSRHHADVCWRGDRFVLSVRSSVNGVDVDGRHCPPGSDVVLAGGERLGLGGYVFECEVRAETWRGDAMGGRALVARTPAPTHAVAGKPAGDPPSGMPWPGTSRDLDDWFSSMTAPSTPDDAAGHPPGVAATGPFDDIFAALDARPSDPSGRDALPLPATSLAASPDAPRTDAIAALEAPALLSRFAHAAGLDPDDLDANRAQETLLLAATLLAQAVGGLHRLLEDRGRTRSELCIADRTAIATRANNPLKHAEDGRDALRHLLDLREHGSVLFMPPVPSVAAAVDDVASHEAALVDGLRAALEATVGAFAPEAIERRIRGAGLLDGVLPAWHKARLWDAFLDLHADLAREAGERFDRVAGTAFQEGYGKRLARRSTS